ncbi:MAG: ATP-binding protein [Gaiellaceae bacterium]
MPHRRLIRRLTGDRRGMIALSVAALGLTLAAAVAVSDPDVVGAPLLLPWVALFAFEVGPALGVFAATTTFGLYLLIVAADGSFDLTPAFIVGRLGSFALIGTGVGLAGQKLRRSEGRSRRLVEGLPLVMYTEDERGLTYISPQIEEVLGYPVSAWLSEQGLWRRAMHREDRDRVSDAYSIAVAERAPFECEYRLVGPDDRCVWVRDSSAFVSDGARSYRQGFIVNVTQRKENEAKIERNGTLMRALVDGTVDGITLTDRKGRIVLANEPMARFVQELAIPSEGHMEDRLLAIADSMVDRERYKERMRELAVAPDLESFDEFEHAESERILQGYTRPAIDNDGTFLGRVWTLRDVTEARQVDRIKDALVATVSHELRTPLTSIIGYLELLEDGDEDFSPETARHVEIVRRNAERLQRMVEELLFLSRVEAGGLPLDLCEIDVAEIARTAIGSAQPAAAAKSLTLNVDSPSSAVTFADSSRIAQVFDNLIANAVKFTPAGGSIEVSVRCENGNIVAGVADTGLGIPAADKPRLFERFFRSASTRDLPGTGLGLTIVRAIVEGHGGQITCDSTEGVGTTFTFRLPLKSASGRTTSRRTQQPAAV